MATRRRDNKGHIKDVSGGGCASRATSFARNAFGPEPGAGSSATGCTLARCAGSV